MHFVRTGLIILALIGGWMLVRGESLAHVRQPDSVATGGAAAQG